MILYKVVLTLEPADELLMKWDWGTSLNTTILWCCLVTDLREDSSNASPIGEI